MSGSSSGKYSGCGLPFGSIPWCMQGAPGRHIHPAFGPVSKVSGHQEHKEMAYLSPYFVLIRHPVPTFDGWVHCRIETALEHCHWSNLRKDQSHGPPVQGD